MTYVCLFCVCKLNFRSGKKLRFITLMAISGIKMYLVGTYGIKSRERQVTKIFIYETPVNNINIYFVI